MAQAARNNTLPATVCHTALATAAASTAATRVGHGELPLHHAAGVATLALKAGVPKDHPLFVRLQQLPLPHDTPELPVHLKPYALLAWAVAQLSAQDGTAAFALGDVAAPPRPPSRRDGNARPVLEAVAKAVLKHGAIKQAVPGRDDATVAQLASSFARAGVRLPSALSDAVAQFALKGLPTMSLRVCVCVCVCVCVIGCAVSTLHLPILDAAPHPFLIPTHPHPQNSTTLCWALTAHFADGAGQVPEAASAFVVAALHHVLSSAPQALCSTDEACTQLLKAVCALPAAATRRCLPPLCDVLVSGASLVSLALAAQLSAEAGAPLCLPMVVVVALWLTAAGVPGQAFPTRP